MPNRSNFTLIIAAVVTAVDLAMISLLAMGLVSERFPRDTQNHMKGLFIGVPCAVLVAGFILVYLWIRRHRDKQIQPDKWLLLGFLSSAPAFVVGGLAFSLSYRWFLRGLFTLGGDWELDPFIETLGFAAAISLAAFWLVFSRSWRSGTTSSREN